MQSVSSDVDDFNAILAAALALAGDAEKARKTAINTLRVGPNLSVELFRVTLAHFRRSEDLDGILDALSLAGLPKWPWGFDPGSRRSLEKAEIETIAIGRVWTGEFVEFGPAILQTSENGTVALRTNSVFSTGIAEVVGDRFCLQHESLLLARSFCGPIYISDEPEYAYTVVNANMVFNFTPD